MLTVTYWPFMLSVIILNVVMLSVVAPVHQEVVSLYSRGKLQRHSMVTIDKAIFVKKNYENYEGS
jgi:hypothetical protein